MSNKKTEKDIRFQQELKTSVGTIVWGKLGSYHWWPAIIINSSDCGQPEAKFGNLWLFWFGDHKISEVSRKKIVEFTSHFSRMFVGISGKKLQKAVFEALEILAARCNYNFENVEALISWAKEEFKGSDTALISSTDMPPFVLKHLEYLQNPSSKAFEGDDADRESDSAEKIFNSSIPLKNIREGLLKIQDICIACYKSEIELVADHPLFEGSLCFECKVRLQENMYVYGNDGKSVCCIICAKPGSLILCDNKNCHRSFCIHCITLLLGPDEKKKIVETDPWYCFFCSCNNGCGLLQIKSDWEDRIMDFFQPSKIHVQELPVQNFVPKSPIRVLSLFDGIGTGKLVLDSLGFEVEVYYASEIDEDAMNVSKLNHMNSITYIGDVTQLTEEKLESLGPIDLVIGGSPCNDLSLVNPFRKGIYDNTGTGKLFFDYFHILKTVQRLNKQRHVFFLYENVAAMSLQTKSIISTFLMNDPSLIDAKWVSPQIRPRYFWGNIPGMHMFNKYCSSLHNDVTPDLGYQEEKLLNHCLLKDLGRKAVVEKIRTVTTQKNSLIQDNYTLPPVEMNGDPDVLWITELEKYRNREQKFLERSA
ncbi:DNA (cytosine-5)-methyltransferase 3A-like isoform X2 [Argiope bruennichi]|uniref:DNA (cytosine-5)-methyltransferase 3A-like isoform X2 n=1 Tax=Argiope bruennichi TaxID=94029 RepID=UPI002494355A|nr:DNA (cytosine-5)-methyltransferase 3A-like isoform X2 [Argiope bruennichi]